MNAKNASTPLAVSLLVTAVLGFASSGCLTAAEVYMDSKTRVGPQADRMGGYVPKDTREHPRVVANAVRLDRPEEIEEIGEEIGTIEIRCRGAECDAMQPQLTLEAARRGATHFVCVGSKILPANAFAWKQSEQHYRLYVVPADKWPGLPKVKRPEALVASK